MVMMVVVVVCWWLLVVVSCWWGEVGDGYDVVGDWEMIGRCRDLMYHGR